MKRDEEGDENEGRSELILQHVKDMDNDIMDILQLLLSTLWLFFRV